MAVCCQVGPLVFDADRQDHCESIWWQLQWVRNHRESKDILERRLCVMLCTLIRVFRFGGPLDEIKR